MRTRVASSTAGNVKERLELDVQRKLVNEQHGAEGVRTYKLRSRHREDYGDPPGIERRLILGHFVHSRPRFSMLSYVLYRGAMLVRTTNIEQE